MSDGAPLLPLLATLNESDNRISQQRERIDQRRLFRMILSASVVAAFLLFIFTAALTDRSRHRLPWETQPDVVFPNFSHYKYYLQTLSVSHFPIPPHGNKRVVAIGDIHGMNDSLSALLTKISYNPRLDTLIHLGDLVSKSENVSSIPTLSFMSTNHILGVRGNNDQKVIEWRAWMHWLESFPGGKEWLEDIDSNWSHIDGDKPLAAFSNWLERSRKQWRAYVPTGWKLQGKHYKVARGMSQEQFDYLCSLPIVLYAPTVHTYFVHAGLLPVDPTRDYNDPKQPLSHLPTTADPVEDDLTSRSLQELALLNEIPQNHDPWLLMNMRSISKDGKVTDNSKKGTPWSDLWNDVMDGCSMTELLATEHDSAVPTPVHCFPSMVVYGHAAARDLDAKRWSVGVDTGCAYGRRLTAVILDVKSMTHSAASGATLQNSQILYGDKGSAQITTVKCNGQFDQ